MTKLNKFNNLNRIFALSLTIVISFILVGCSGKDQPKNELITKDLENKVLEYCQNLTLSGYDVTESMTNEGSYDATIRVDVKSKYANITLSADVEYVKYDQGWKLENCDLQEVSREINYPTNEEILKLLESEPTYQQYLVNSRDVSIISLDKVIECIDGKIVIEATFEKNLDGMKKVKGSKGKKNLEFLYMLDNDTDGFIYTTSEIVSPPEINYLDLGGEYELTEFVGTRNGESLGFGENIEIQNWTENNFDLVIKDSKSSETLTYEMKKTEEESIYIKQYVGNGPLGRIVVRLSLASSQSLSLPSFLLNANAIVLRFGLHGKAGQYYIDGDYMYIIE